MVNEVISLEWHRREMISRRGNSVLQELLGLEELTLALQRWELYGLEDESREVVIGNAWPLVEFFLGRVGVVFKGIGPGAPAEAADLAFFALQQIKGLRKEFARLVEGGEAREIVETCQRLRGQFMQVGSALHRVLREAAGVERVDHVYESEVTKALAVRRKYAAFRAELERGATAGATDPVKKMRLAGTALAMLVGCRQYTDFRLGDRALIRKVQRDVLAWLRRVDRDERDAQCIWRDLVGFVEVSRRVDQRVSLVEHDQGALRKLHHGLGTVQDGRPVGDEPLSLARAVWGRFSELDVLMESREPVDGSAWRRCVEQLCREHVADGLGLDDNGRSQLQSRPA